MIHYVERLIEPSHALEIDAAVKKPSSVEASTEHGPIKPVLLVS
jgi:hypothetical protein